MTDSPELAALLRAILDAPADDLPRLVFADWLEEHDKDEHGESERAEFIRLQIAGAWATLRQPWLIPIETCVGAQPQQFLISASRGEARAHTPNGLVLI